MDQDRWRTINRIFHAALDVDADQRPALIVAESNGDAEVQAEVESLLQADADAGFFLESPAFPTAALSTTFTRLAPGDILCGRFRIVREIAEGGMGTVYEAFDAELSVPVALKVIRPEVASNPEAIARFRQEVRLARSITHPNICRTFDLEREVRGSDEQRTEFIFLTMEFLPGETLAAHLARKGPLPASEVLRLARQVAAALHAAHSLGVIHRDLKPANIMLVTTDTASGQAPRAVVTDFGLARLDPLLALDGHSSFTQTGHPIGTLAYMAPEQLSGGAVSPATDVYAFGLILFEMIMGKRAFHSNNLLSGIAQRLRESLPLEDLLPAGLPLTWRHALVCCLAIKPTDRHSEINDVIALLEGERPRLLWRVRYSRFFSGARSRRIVIASTSLLLAVALLLLGLRLYRRADSTVVPGALVYLTPVKNGTGEHSLDGLTELIRAGLSQSMQVNLLDEGRVGDMLQRMTKSPEGTIDAATAREIAMRTGSTRVVFATVTGSHGRYSLNIEMQQPDNTPARYRERWRKSFAWTADAAAGSSTIPPELLASVRSASDWIRHAVGESAEDLSRLDAAPQDVTTSNWDALKEYVEAQRLASRGMDEAAVTALQRAVSLDGGFALAYARLGDILVSEGHTSEGFKAYDTALDASHERRLSRRERDRIKGMYAYDSGDVEAAEAAFRDYVSFYENDPNGWAYRVGPLIDLGRTDEAIASLRRLNQLKPGTEFGVAELVNCFLRQGKYDEAKDAIEQVRRAGYPDKAQRLEGVRQFLLGNFGVAESIFTALAHAHTVSEQRQSLPLLARLYAERAAYPLALKTLDEAVRGTTAPGDAGRASFLLLDRASIQQKLGNNAGLLSDIEASLKHNLRAEGVIKSAALLGHAFDVALPAERPALQRALEGLSHDVPPGGSTPAAELMQMRLQTELHHVRGDWKASLAAATRAATLDAPAESREYLGRALVEAAKHQSDPAMARRMQSQAIEAYGVVASQPGAVWYHPTSKLPGAYADQLLQYVRLTAKTGARTPEAQEAAERLSRLRTTRFDLRSAK